MTRARRSANRIRRLILVVGVIYSVVALVWLVSPEFHLLGSFGLLGTPFTIFYDTTQTFYLLVTVLLIGLLLLAQWAFLRPGRGWTVQLATEGRPLRSAVIAAAAMAMLLSFGGIVLLLEIPDWWVPLASDPSGFRVMWGVMVLLWFIWAWVFFIYWRQGDRYTQLGRMIRGLVAGSLLEAFIAVPVHIAVLRRGDCYCERGTYTTLVFAGTVILWAFGLGIILLYWRERYRRNRLFPLCDECGYDLRGSSGICPECGTPYSVIEE